MPVSASSSIAPKPRDNSFCKMNIVLMQRFSSVTKDRTVWLVTPPTARDKNLEQSCMPIAVHSRKMNELFPFICVLLCSVAAIDFDSEYQPPGQRLTMKSGGNPPFHGFFRHRIRLSDFFPFLYFHFAFSPFSSQVRARFSQS